MVANILGFLIQVCGKDSIPLLKIFFKKKWKLFLFSSVKIGNVLELKNNFSSKQILNPISNPIIRSL